MSNMVADVRIATVDQSEIEEFLRVEREAFGGPCSTERFLVVGSKHRLYAAYDHLGIIGGLAAFKISKDPPTWNILSLFVLPKYGRRGVAGQLLTRFLQDVPNGSINVLVETELSPIYQRFGFKIKTYGMELERKPA